MEHRWNEIDRGKTEILGEKPVPVPLCPPQIPHGPTPGSNPGLRGEMTATNRLSHGAAKASYFAHNIPLMYHILTQMKSHFRAIFSYHPFLYWFILPSVLYYAKWHLPVRSYDLRCIRFYFPSAYYVPRLCHIRSYRHRNNVIWKNVVRRRAT
jgi:hypothetical protein